MEKINEHLSEFDGSGSGIMTAKQMLAACRSIKNLGFNEEELENYIEEGKDVAGDGNGKIRMAEFASYLAFEAKKKYKKLHNNNNKTNVNGTKLMSNNSQSTQSQSNGADYVNPFMDFMSPDNNQQNNQKQQLNGSQQQQNTKGMTITLTPDPFSHYIICIIYLICDFAIKNNYI